jgi:hypothetical protein
MDRRFKDFAHPGAVGDRLNEWKRCRIQSSKSIGYRIAPPIVALMIVFGSTAISAAARPKVAIALTTDEKGQRVFELRGLDQTRRTAIEKRPEGAFAVYAVFDTELTDPPPLSGSYEVFPDRARFTPRFPLEPGMRYRAVYRHAGATVTEGFAVPTRAAAPAVRVAAIYPSSNVLPQNQLKFYLHFTAPMSRGDAYKHLDLLDADGDRVDLPFLELSEELWNPAGDRLTLLLDPARVKRELKPREEEGPVLEVGRHYTLVVRRELRDATGQPLADDFRKTFAVAEADETCPQPNRWRLTLPQAGTDSPLTVEFGEPLDHALLERMLWVVDRDGELVPGKGATGRDEKSWTFRPHKSWQPGEHRLVADTWLEDLAGNSISRRFELDRGRVAKPVTEEETFSVEFIIRE